MRKLLLAVHLILCLINKVSNAQINLVPNSGFEDTIPCTTSMISPNLAAVGWYSAYGSPDYYNAVYAYTCGYHVNYAPNNGWGYQMPLDGNAYVGFSTYCVPADCGANSREWLQIQLSSGLLAGKKHLVSFYVSLASNCKYATDDIGAALTAVSAVPLGFASQINNPSGNFITDTINWTLISGVMTAIGGEQYITIGNFKNDANTTIVSNNPSAIEPGTYYLTDVVSVYELPDIEAGLSDSICLGDTVHLNANSGPLWGGLQYRWFPSVGLSDTTILNPVAAPSVTTTYYFGLIDTTGNIPGMVNYVDSLTIVVGCTNIEEYGNDLYGIMYPNPANTTAYYEIELENNETGFVELFDLLGNRVASQKLQAGSNKAEIDLTQLSNGLYVYKVVVNGTLRNSDKLIITK